jgi:exopolyphosphatase/guanosine-5'-triphosphate,3'-diphosphate pyrophosphatase
MVSIDLGSNTIRALEFDCKNAKRLKEFETVVGSARGLNESGLIGKEALEKILKATKEIKRSFDFSHGYKAVATAAFRVAKNAKEVIDEIKDKTGVEFEIISSEIESDYTLEAVAFRLHEANIDIKNYLVMDLGGGSTEITFVKGEKRVSKSFDIGIVTAASLLKNSKKTLKELLTDVELFVKKELSIADVERFIATSGTPTTIASFLEGIDYEHYNYGRVNLREVGLKEMGEVLDELLNMSEKERVKWVGEGREDLIFVGVEMVREIVKICGFDKMTVIDDGLREGVAIKMCNDGGF